jgi:hypothetical protein
LHVSIEMYVFWYQRWSPDNKGAHNMSRTPHVHVSAWPVCMCEVFNKYILTSLSAQPDSLRPSTKVHCAKSRQFKYTETLTKPFDVYWFGDISPQQCCRTSNVEVRVLGPEWEKDICFTQAAVSDLPENGRGSMNIPRSDRSDNTKASV